MTPEVRNLAANAAREIERGYPPPLCLNLKKLASTMGAEPLWDNLGHYLATGAPKFKKEALFSCHLIADLQ